MKRILPIAALAILAACGGGNAQAQTIDNSFKASNGDIANISDAVYVALSNGYLTFKTSNPQPTTVADGTAALYNKIVADPKFQEDFVRNTQNLVWYRIDKIVVSRCTAGKTYFYFTNDMPGVVMADNCAAYYQIQARSK